MTTFWTVCMQEEAHGRNKNPVKCKKVKFRPQETPNGTNFIALGFDLLQVIIEDSRNGDMLRLKVSFARGLNNPNFFVQHPDKVGKPKIWVGAGKKRYQVNDVLAPDERIPGEKETYANFTDFEKRIRQIAGKAISDEVIELFVAKIQSCVGREAA